MAESDSQASRAERPTWRGALQLILIVGVIAAAIFFARAPSRDYLELDPDDAERPIEPTAAVIQPVATEAARSLRLTGMVTTLGTVDVRPEVSGRIVKVSENFRSGGEFSAGETLVQIETEEFELSLARAKFGLEFARGELLEKQDGEARAADLKERYPDHELLPGLGRAWLALDGEIQQAQAQVDIAEARIALAEWALDNTRIRMPFDGYVTSTRVSKGQVVRGLESNLGDVFPKHQLRVRAKISNFDLDALEPAIGRKATVTANGRTYDAQVERVSRVVDVDTRLANLYLQIADQEERSVLPRPGTFANVSLEGPTYGNVYVLPEAAMQINGTVWLVDDGNIESFTPDSLGHAEDGWLVRAFDSREGVVVGRIPGVREGLAVRAVAHESP